MELRELSPAKLPRWASWCPKHVTLTPGRQHPHLHIIRTCHRELDNTGTQVSPEGPLTTYVRGLEKATKKEPYIVSLDSNSRASL